jgi:multicomponent Na+:H+ antiporter subunit C
MTWTVALCVWACLAAGCYLMTSRDLLRIVVGGVVLGSGANLLLFASGRLGTMAPPVIEAGAMALPPTAANPLPQALVLTAIVIGFSLACFAFVLVLRLTQRSRTDDATALRLTEPRPTDPVKPPLPAAPDEDDGRALWNTEPGVGSSIPPGSSRRTP